MPPAQRDVAASFFLPLFAQFGASAALRQHHLRWVPLAERLAGSRRGVSGTSQISHRRWSAIAASWEIPTPCPARLPWQDLLRAQLRSALARRSAAGVRRNRPLVGWNDCEVRSDGKPCQPAPSLGPLIT